MAKIAGQRLGRTSLTRGNVADSHTPGNNTPETDCSNLRMAESKSAALPIFPVRKQAGASAVATPLWHPRRLDHNARRDAPLSFAQFERASLSRGLKGFRSRPPKNEKYPGVSKEQG